MRGGGEKKERERERTRGDNLPRKKERECIGRGTGINK